jgi:hypothetical protein
MEPAHDEAWNETGGSAVLKAIQPLRTVRRIARLSREHQERAMISETQIHTIARQMLERHGSVAIAHAAHNALTCEREGQVEQADEWRHVKDAMKIMQGPHQS